MTSHRCSVEDMSSEHADHGNIYWRQGNYIRLRLFGFWSCDGDGWHHGTAVGEMAGLSK